MGNNTNNYLSPGWAQQQVRPYQYITPYTEPVDPWLEGWRNIRAQLDPGTAIAPSTTRAAVVPSGVVDPVTPDMGNVTNNWFSGGGPDGVGNWGRVGDILGGGGEDLRPNLTANQLRTNDADAASWSWGQRKLSDGTVVDGIGNTVMGLGNMALQGYLGWKELSIAEESLGLKREAFEDAKTQRTKDRKEHDEYNRNVGSAILGRR